MLSLAIPASSVGTNRIDVRVARDTKAACSERENTSKRSFLEVEQVRAGSFREQQLGGEFTVHRVYNIYYSVIIDWKYEVKETIWCTNKIAHAACEYESGDVSRGGRGY